VTYNNKIKMNELFSYLSEFILRDSPGDWQANISVHTPGTGASIKCVLNSCNKI
jgi:hypothetical protein